MKVEARAAFAAGNELEVHTVDLARLSESEVLVRVDHCGVCHSDVHMIDNDWGIADYPIVPGHEVVGEVVEVGSSVRHLKPGQRVGVGWQRSACLVCADCLAGDENLCPDTKTTIGDGAGGFATHVRVDAHFAFALPDELPSATTGPLLCGGITSYSALHYAGLRTGSNVGVIGIGGLGHFAVQFAAKLGHRVTVFTSSDDKAELATQLGATDVVVGRNPRDVKLKRRLDIIVNTAPADLDWDGYMSLLDTDGVLTLVANPPSPLAIRGSSLMFKRRKVMGSVIGGRAIMNDMLRVAADHGVTAVTEHYSLDQVNDAIRAVRENTVRFRAVIDVNA